MESRYFTGSIPFLTLSHTSKTCDHHEAFTPTTTFKEKYLGRAGMLHPKKYIGRAGMLHPIKYIGRAGMPHPKNPIGAPLPMKIIQSGFGNDRPTN